MSFHVSRGLNIKVIDSLNFFPFPLSALPKLFGINELKKGYFPHKMNLLRNQTYVGPYPNLELYGCDSMNEVNRSAFLKWHREKIENNCVFDFAQEMLNYCRSDVDILRRSALIFRKLLMDITGETESIVQNDDIYNRDETISNGIDPFTDITIAGVCSRVYRTNFLWENWEVKIKNEDGTRDEWVPGTITRGKLTVSLNNERLNERELQERGYVIVEKRFVSSPLAQVPSQGYTAQDQYSVSSIKWLEWLMEHSRRQGNPIHIQHALNGGEVKLPGTRYKVDGYSRHYDPKLQSYVETCYEFNGCRFHGCKICQMQPRLTRTNQSMDELFALTIQKKEYIRSLNMKCVDIWEHDFVKLVKSDASVRDFINGLDIQERLNPRDAFFGGRTNATKLLYETKSDETIEYVDYTSLYPSVQKYGRFPISNPRIITDNFKSIENYFGIAKIKILPPRNLYHPVLPYRVNKKLHFPLCHTCVTAQNQLTCACTDEKRALLGTWCTPEILKSVSLGYKVIQIYEVYHFDETSKYDPQTGEGGLFHAYVNLFLKLKQSSSGLPSWCKTERDVELYIERYFENEGIRLDKNDIRHNSALRSLAKLLLNSFWGKFGQRLNMPHTTFYHEHDEAKFFQCLSDRTKIVKDFNIITDDTISVTWENNSLSVPDNAQTNIFIAAFTTTWARLKLYELLELLNERVLYYDTDSVIYVSRPGQIRPSLGDYLGMLTSELDQFDHITTFVGAGPKQYAYTTALGKQACKIRGFSLNYTNSKLLNFESLLDLVKKSRDDNDDESRQALSIDTINTSKISRHKTKVMIYNRPELKRYKIVYSKRVIQKDSYDTLPYGY